MERRTLQRIVAGVVIGLAGIVAGTDALLITVDHIYQGHQESLRVYDRGLGYALAGGVVGLGVTLGVATVGTVGYYIFEKLQDRED